MDPVSHAILGRAAIAAGGLDDAPRRGRAAAAVLGALSPDVDFVLMPIGWDTYLRAHEIGTHSLAGAVLTGLGSAAIIRLVRRGSDYRSLAVAAVIGSFSHILADIASGARLRPGWPLLDAITSVPLVAMADPGPIVVLFIGAMGMLLRPQRRSRTGRATIAALLLLFVVKGVLLTYAMREAMSSPEFSRGADRVADARWATIGEWDVFDRTDDSLRQWRLSVLRPPVALITRAIEPESPLITASRQLDTVRNFLAVHDLTFAVERVEQNGTRTVLWSDVRFCDPEAAAPVRCALWFGGVFDPDGRPLTQRVLVGSWVQERPPPVNGRSR